VRSFVFRTKFIPWFSNILIPLKYFQRTMQRMGEWRLLAVQRPLAAVHFSEISIKRQHWTGDDPKLTDYQPSFVSLDSIILITEFARS